MDNLKIIFNDISNNKWENVKKMMNKEKKNIDYNIPINGIYFLELILINNKVDIINLIINLEIDLFLNIFDNENNPIIFVAIKYNYIEILKKILNYDNNNIGISLIDIKNNKGQNILLYSLSLNNYDIIKFILEHLNNNYDYFDNNLDTPFHYLAKYSNLKIASLFKISGYNLDKQNIYGESCLHIAIQYNNNDLLKLFLKNNINLNIKDFKTEFTAIHHLIINNKYILIEYLIKNNLIEYNFQDYKGRTYLHYLIIYNREKLLLKVLNESKYKINFKLCDINGLTPLHMILQSQYFKNNYEILNILIQNTNINLQDNKGNTCLYYIISNNMWKNFIDILKKKKIDIFVYNLKNIQLINIIKKEEIDDFIDIIIQSFYNYLKKKNHDYDLELNFCKTNNSLKIFKKKYPEFYENLIKNDNNLKKNNICYNIIKYYILKKKISFPEKKNKLCIKLKKPIKLAFVPYTGSNLDILCGLYYLESNFNNVKTSLNKNFIENEKLENYYKTIGKTTYNKIGQDFYNLEIIWDKQKLIFPTNFKNLILNLKKRFLIIPIGIEIDIGYHSNILIYDSMLNLVERFEPNGSSSPYGYYYNSSKLDMLIKYKLKKYLDNFVYIGPKDYLPKIGLQVYENIEQKKKKIGDPGGYCSSWSLWYASMKLKYPSISYKKLIYKLIYTLKKNQISFKEKIRAFTNDIIIIRNGILDNTGIDINDWINNNYSIDQYNNLVKKIINKFNL